MKRLIILALIFAIKASSAQTKQTVTASTVTYQIKNLGINTTGTFGGLQAVIAFDKEHLSTSSISATVDVKAINSDNDMRDEHLKSADFFDVAHYPTISIKSISFKQKSGNKFMGTFELTIRNKTKNVDVPFTYADNGSTAIFNGSFKINRLDFGIGDESLTLSNETILNVNIQTSK